EREEVGDDLWRSCDVLGVKPEHREAAAAPLTILLDPGQDSRLFEPRWQDARVVAEVTIGLCSGLDDPGMVPDLSSPDQTWAWPRFDCHSWRLAEVPRWISQRIHRPRQYRDR